MTFENLNLFFAAILNLKKKKEKKKKEKTINLASNLCRINMKNDILSQFQR